MQLSSKSQHVTDIATGCYMLFVEPLAGGNCFSWEEGCRLDIWHLAWSGLTGKYCLLKSSADFEPHIVIQPG